MPATDPLAQRMHSLQLNTAPCGFMSADPIDSIPLIVSL